MNLYEVAILVLGTLGGASVIVGGLSVWLGKVWAKRIAERERHVHAKEIELLKAQIGNEQRRNSRTEDAEFKLYNEVWGQLQEVNTQGDELWANASRNNWEAFLISLRNAHLAMNKGRLILTDNHYQQLCEIMPAFEYYARGKEELIELRSSELQDSAFNEFLERRQIQENARYRNRYQQLLDEIAGEFKKQLRI